MTVTLGSLLPITPSSAPSGRKVAPRTERQAGLEGWPQPSGNQGLRLPAFCSGPEASPTVLSRAPRRPKTVQISGQSAHGCHVFPSLHGEVMSRSCRATPDLRPFGGLRRCRCSRGPRTELPEHAVEGGLAVTALTDTEGLQQ